VEARERIGGRIFSMHDPLAPVAIELGAELIHGRPPEIWDLARENGLAVYDCSGDSITADEGALDVPDDDEFARVFVDLQERAGSGNDETFLEFLNRSDYSEAAKRSAAAFVEGFNAARKDIIGIASLAEDMRASDGIGGDRSYRLAGGYGGLVTALARGVDVRLNSAVDRIEWKRGAVALHLEGEQVLRAGAVVLTLPLGVLKAGAVRFDPEP